MSKPARLMQRDRAPSDAPGSETRLSPAVVHALRIGLLRLDRAARHGDQPTIHETARTMAELAERHGLDQVKWQARALLTWHEDERAAEARLTTLVDGLFLSSAPLLRLDNAGLTLH